MSTSSEGATDKPRLLWSLALAAAFPVVLMLAAEVHLALALALVPVVCGGVTVAPGDIVVADEEGIVVLPAARASKILADAEARAARDATTSLDAWVANHKARIDETTRALGI